MFCCKTWDIQKRIFLENPLYGDIEDQIWMSSWRCSNSRNPLERNWCRWSRSNPGVGYWPFTTRNTLVYICYGTTSIFFGFRCSGAPLRITHYPCWKEATCFLYPHGRCRKGVDPWNFLLGSVRVQHRNTVNPNLSQIFTRFPPARPMGEFRGLTPGTQ